MWMTIGVVVILVLGVLGFAATRPDDFTVQRSTSIKAEPAKIYPLLVDFSQWPAGSPWEKLDPNMQRTFSGPASGKGASYAWRGNDDVGEGAMTIADSRPLCATWAIAESGSIGRLPAALATSVCSLS